MARTPRWETVEMAVGAPKPAWPMPSVQAKFAVWSFGGGRPFGCKLGACERWHAGIDLTVHETVAARQILGPPMSTA